MIWNGFSSSSLLNLVLLLSRYLFPCSGRWLFRQCRVQRRLSSVTDVHSAVRCRLNRLLTEIMAEAENKTLIFTETKKRADELTMRMRREGSVLA